MADAEWVHVENDEFEEGDLVWIQDKDGPSTNVGYVILKDEWTFMLNNRPAVYKTMHWYVSKLKEENEEDPQ